MSCWRGGGGGDGRPGKLDTGVRFWSENLGLESRRLAGAGGRRLPVHQMWVHRSLVLGLMVLHLPVGGFSSWLVGSPTLEV